MKDLMVSDILSAPSNEEVVATHRKYEYREVGAWKLDAVTIEAKIKSSGMLWRLNLYPIAVSTIGGFTGVVGLDSYDEYFIVRWERDGEKITGSLRKLTDKEKAVFWKLCGGDFTPHFD